MEENLHACCISLEGRGVLLLGESGSGKSDLALRLIRRGALLVADDYVNLKVKDGQLIATAPDTIRGLLEVRGIGVVQMTAELQAPVMLAVQLTKEATSVVRLPQPQQIALLGRKIPVISLYAFEAAAVEKVTIALDIVAGDVTLVEGGL